ncbi:YbgC/FadM family acyl-CoA thioesterase [Diaphorobacter aerolatus]|uniref:YbgC/FadM family acyl-CoA thioesterase n=1 Tax=Diaphorobacter aerolatus TaxID=1288495 RepID=A0A7H0GK82_9BURK|nr:YbgC/FadM family acyl-CoA thioesterase [Diaphorobacter aerolatus]QNP48698.1 YbgC/FadM family acyl-CoA thioesterase [Diaphorobacter aerolatus]
MKRQDFRCVHRLRVRWAEVDVQKIVFNAHYLTYADIGMAEYWRGLAMPYEATMQKLHGDIYLKKATVEYHASARMDDLLDIGMRCARVGNSSLGFECGIFAGDRLLASVALVYVYADPVSQSSRPVPQLLREAIEQFEAGHEMVTLKLGDWATLGQNASEVRKAVFIEEQGISPEIELDELDATAVHAVAFNRLDMPVATGRLLQDAPGEARIGRMAVARVLRGQRWGRAILDALVEESRRRGDARVILHAQCSAEGFYQRANFVAVGEPYEEAGIAHITMQKMLG